MIIRGNDCSLRAFACHKLASRDRKIVPVQNHCLGNIRKLASVDHSNGVIVIFDRIDTAGKSTAVDHKRRDLIFRRNRTGILQMIARAVRIIVTVGDHA